MSDTEFKNQQNIPFTAKEFTNPNIILGIIPQDKHTNSSKNNLYLEWFGNWVSERGYNPKLITITQKDYSATYPEFGDIYTITQTTGKQPFCSRLALISIADLIYANVGDIVKAISRKFPISRILSRNETYILGSDSSKLIDKFWKSNTTIENLCKHSNFTREILLDLNITDRNAETMHKADELNLAQISQIVSEVIVMRREDAIEHPKQSDEVKKRPQRNGQLLSQILKDRILKEKTRQFDLEI